MRSSRLHFVLAIANIAGCGSSAPTGRSEQLLPPASEEQPTVGPQSPPSPSSSPSPLAAPSRGGPVTPVFGQIAFGHAHACARTREGAVACWGESAYLQLGVAGEPVRKPFAPRLVSGVEGVVEIAAGGYTTCARKGDGTVACWGNMPLGITKSARPVVVADLVDARSIAVGESHACAVVASGGVACWGANEGGESGQPRSNKVVSKPTLVPGIVGARSVVAGRRHACALVERGSVRCWGRNEKSQLGDESKVDRPGAVDVRGISGAVALGAFGDNTCAVLGSGEVSCWGARNIGPLAGPVPGVTEAVAVAGGAQHACALRRDGSAVCWGSDRAGERGSGAATSPPGGGAGAPVEGLVGAASIAAGASTTCAMRGGAISCWGDNASGLLGQGDDRYVRTPAEVKLSAKATDLVAARDATCVLLADRTVQCWGAGFRAAVYDVKPPRSMPTPALVPGLAGVTSLLPLGATLCARDGGTDPWCVYAGAPQGADEPPDPLWKPSRVAGVGSITSIERRPEVRWTYAVTSGGGVAAVLVGTRYDKASRTTQHQVENRPVTGFPLAVAASGYSYAAPRIFCVVDATGRVACVRDEDRDLGPLPTTVKPIFVPGVSDAIDVEVSAGRVCVVSRSGDVRCSTADIKSSQAGAFAVEKVEGLAPVVDLARDTKLGRKLCAVTRGGEVACWSDDESPDFEGTHCTGIDRQRKPATCPSIADATKIVAGYEHFCALTRSGGVSCWGNNGAGGVGASGLSRSTVPIAIAAIR